MKIKTYDKIMSLFAKDGHSLIVSQINKVIGSNHTIDDLQQQIRYAKIDFMTRREISYNFYHSEKFTLVPPS